MATYTLPGEGPCPDCDTPMSVRRIVRNLNPNRTADDAIPQAAYRIRLACDHVVTCDSDSHEITDQRAEDTTLLQFERTSP